MQIESNLCFIPTTTGGNPHLGHLWYIMNLAVLYQEIQQIFHSHISPIWGDASIELYLCIDNPSCGVSVYEKEYKNLFEWLFGDQFKTISLNDLHSQLTTHDSFQHFVGLHKNVNISNDATKLAFFDFTNIRWHLRGVDLVGLENNERALNTFLKFREPKYLYLSLLRDEEGTILNSSRVEEQSGNEAYQVHNLFDKKHPYNVVLALARALKVREYSFTMANKIIDSASQYDKLDIDKRMLWMSRFVIRFWSLHYRSVQTPFIFHNDDQVKLHISRNWSDTI